MDDPFGFKAEVVIGDESFPLYRCTPFLTIYTNQHMSTINDNERFLAVAEAIPESRHQMQTMSSADNRGQSNATSHPVWPEDTDAHNSHNHLIFTDGGSPLAMAMGGIGNYKPNRMDSHVLLLEEEWDKHPRTKMKKGGKRGGKKSRRKQRQ
ncbi:uncharacterized protein Hap1MRO34_013748 [Clarias gariepinus]